MRYLEKIMKEIGSWLFYEKEREKNFY